MMKARTLMFVSAAALVAVFGIALWLCDYHCWHMAVAECFAIARDIIVSGAALVTALVAVPGLHRWKRELLGKASIKAAQNLLRATNEIKKAVESCRDPFLANEEFPKDYNDRSNDPKEQARMYAHVYNNRWQKVRSAREKFDDAVFEAWILWGSDGDVQAKAEKIRKCLQELFRALYAYVRNIESDGEHFKEDKKRKDQVDWVIGLTRKPNAEFTASEDWFEKHGNDAIADIEKLARKHLNQK